MASYIQQNYTFFGNGKGNNYPIGPSDRNRVFTLELAAQLVQPKGWMGGIQFQ